MKRKITQNDLRLLMQEKKRKLTEAKRKIDSPLAKYLDDGTLLCIICNSVVKSETLWHVHINSKQHRDSIARKKQAKERPPILPPVVNSNIKKEPNSDPVNPPMKLKGILKNKTEDNTSQFNNTIFVSNTTSNQDTSSQMDVDIEPVNNTTNELPEGFFDDPIMDAKARNVDYKDPIEEEWERFQKEIQEENILSEQILDEDQETATADKEIERIDEDMHRWSRIQMLEEEVETAVQKKALKWKNTVNLPIQANDDDADSSYGSDEDFDEYIDWRSKKSFK